MTVDTCSGSSQSPINIVSANALMCRARCGLTFNYRSSRCNIVRTDNSLYLKYDSGSFVIYNGNVYELERISFATPSAHKIDGTTASLECQMYHKAPDTGKILITSVMYDVNEAVTSSKTFYDSWTREIPRAGNTEKEVMMKSEWNIFNALPQVKSFYIYEGSLPMSPCTEGITWIVFANRANISNSSQNQFTSVITMKNRNTQMLNNRTILFNPNASERANVNQATPIMCLNDKELVEKCNNMGILQKNSLANKQNNVNFLLAVIAILFFMFALVMVVLYRFGFFTRILALLQPKLNQAVRIGGVGS